MKTYTGEYGKDLAVIGNKKNEVVSIAKTELVYPGIFKAGTVAILTVKYGSTIGTINEFKSGKFSAFRKAFKAS